jgi:peroxiredoxin
MKKSTIIKLLVLCVLLISPGIFSLIISGNRSPANTGSGSSSPDRLMAGIGTSEHPFATDTSDIRLQSITGDVVRLDDFRGKVVLLNFWATWCPTCVSEMPVIEKLHRELSGKNFVMLAVNVKESASRVKSFFEKNKLTFTALLDTSGEVTTEFGLRAIPTTFIIDKNGSIIGVAMFEQLADG